MQTDVSRPVRTGIVTFAVSALAAASLMYWSLKGWGSSASSAAPVVMQQPAPFNSLAVAQALGGGGSPVAAAPNVAPTVSRYALVGVVAGYPRVGAALIAVDGQEARPVRVGSLVDNDMVLESVNGRRAVLASSTGTAQKVVLDMPKLAD